MDIVSFVLIPNFGIVISAALLYYGISIYRFIRAYWNTDGD